MLDKPGWSEKYITNDESKNTHNIIDVNNFILLKLYNIIL